MEPLNKEPLNYQTSKKMVGVESPENNFYSLLKSNYNEGQTFYLPLFPDKHANFLFKTVTSLHNDEAIQFKNENKSKYKDARVFAALSFKHKNEKIPEEHSITYSQAGTNEFYKKLKNAKVNKNFSDDIKRNLGKLHEKITEYYNSNDKDQVIMSAEKELSRDLHKEFMQLIDKQPAHAEEVIYNSFASKLIDSMLKHNGEKPEEAIIHVSHLMCKSEGGRNPSKAIIKDTEMEAKENQEVKKIEKEKFAESCTNKMAIVKEYCDTLNIKFRIIYDNSYGNDNRPYDDINQSLKNDFGLDCEYNKGMVIADNKTAMELEQIKKNNKSK